MARKRISISVDDNIYSQLSTIRQAYSFRSISELSVSLLSMLCKSIEAQQKGTSLECADYDVIRIMFESFAEFERSDEAIRIRRQSSGKR